MEKDAALQAALAECRKKSPKYAILSNTCSCPSSMNSEAGKMLSDHTVRVVNTFLQDKSVFKGLEAVGLKPKHLENPIHIQFEYSRQYFKNFKKTGSSSRRHCTKRKRVDKYAFSWVDPKVNLQTIFIDAAFLGRYTKIYQRKGSDDEIHRIVVLLAWKVLHELGHLAYRWENGPSSHTPITFNNGESGEYVEKIFLGHGTSGFAYHSSNQWNGSQHINGLLISNPTANSFESYRVTDEYVKRAWDASLDLTPLAPGLFPVLKEPFVRVEGLTVLTSTTSSSRKGLAQASTFMDRRGPFIKLEEGLFAAIPRCAKRFWQTPAPEPRPRCPAAPKRLDFEDPVRPASQASSGERAKRLSREEERSTRPSRVLRRRPSHLPP